MLDAALEHLALVLVQLDLDDPLDAVGAQDAGDADEVAADAVLLVAVDGAGEDALLVADDRLGHLHGGGGGGVVGAAGLEQADDLGPAGAGALDDLLQALRLDK